MRFDSRLEGGPYNGNSFYIEEEDKEFRITSSTATYSVQHVYDRKDEYTFTYKGTTTLQ